MILVTGAGGKTGKAVIKALVARGAPVRAFVRSPAHEAALRAMGTSEVFAGQMDDPHVLLKAVQGVDAVYHICPNVSPHEIAFAKTLIAAAADAGVSRLAPIACPTPSKRGSVWSISMMSPKRPRWCSRPQATAAPLMN
jgi:NAD(P)H dehydrogenase (quinone)